MKLTAEVRDGTLYITMDREAEQILHKGNPTVVNTWEDKIIRALSDTYRHSVHWSSEEHHEAE